MALLIALGTGETLSQLGGLSISAEAFFYTDPFEFEFHYLLNGDSEIAGIPPGDLFQVGKRRDKLWQSTCFEAFFSSPPGDPYYELNFSAEGDWNAYSFSSYRKGMSRVENCNLVKFEKSYNSEIQQTKLIYRLSFAPISAEDCQLSLTTVIRNSHNHELFYFALGHASIEADFHNRKTFIGRFSQGKRI